MKNLIQIGRDFYTPAQIALYNKRHELGVQSKEDIRNGQVTFKEGCLYFRQVITAHAGIQEYIQDNMDKSVGITNINKGVIPEGYNMAVENIFLGYATKLLGQNDPLAVNDFSNLASNAHATLRNAELKFLVGNQPIMPPVPVSQLLTLAALDKHIKDAGMMLDNPPILKAGDKFQIAIEYPAAMPATEEHFIEVILTGPLLG